LLYRDGLPVAMLTAGEVRFLEDLDPAAEWEANKALLRAEFAPSVSAERQAQRLVVTVTPRA
jgi:hypothetical protein